MGFLGFGNYNKPGPGISKNEPQKHRFFLFFSIYFRKFWNLVKLNLLFFAFCSPVFISFICISYQQKILAIVFAVIGLFTVVPATCGMFYVLRNYTQERHAFLFSDFIDAFKNNYKQAILVTLIDIVVFFVLFNSYFFWSNGDVAMPQLLKTIASAFIIMISIIYIFMHYYMYTLIVSFYLNLKQLFKNCFIFAIVGLWRNILITIILLILSVGLYIVAFSPGIVLFFTIAFSTLAFIVSFITYPLIKKYMIDPVLNEQKNDENDDEDDEIIFEDKV